MPRRIGVTRPLARVWMWALVAGAYSFLTLSKAVPPFSYIPAMPAGLDAALSFAMALLIAFRVNRAYEKWWEARRLWGTLVNVSRNLAVKVREILGPPPDQCKTLRDLIVANSLGLKDHLRDAADLRRLPGFEDTTDRPKHLPSYTTQQIYRQFHNWQTDGRLSDQQLWVLDTEARVFLDVCGSCERIKTTRLPISSRFVTWQCIALYLLILPWGIVDDFGAWTIPITVLAAYLIIAAEAIAHYVEEPFGMDEDHLDLDGICAGIDRSVGEILQVGERGA